MFSRAFELITSVEHKAEVNCGKQRRFHESPVLSHPEQWIRIDPRQQWKIPFFVAIPAIAAKPVNIKPMVAGSGVGNRAEALRSGALRLAPKNARIQKYPLTVHPEEGHFRNVLFRPHP